MANTPRTPSSILRGVEQRDNLRMELVESVAAEHVICMKILTSEWMRRLQQFPAGTCVRILPQDDDRAVVTAVSTNFVCEWQRVGEELLRVSSGEFSKLCHIPYFPVLPSNVEEALPLIKQILRNCGVAHIIEVCRNRTFAERNMSDLTAAVAADMPCDIQSKIASFCSVAPPSIESDTHDESVGEWCDRCCERIEDYGNWMVCDCEFNCCDNCAVHNPYDESDNTRYCEDCVPE